MIATPAPVATMAHTSQPVEASTTGAGASPLCRRQSAGQAYASADMRRRSSRERSPDRHGQARDTGARPDLPTHSGWPARAARRRYSQACSRYAAGSDVAGPRLRWIERAPVGFVAPRALNDERVSRLSGQFARTLDDSTRRLRLAGQGFQPL